MSMRFQFPKTPAGRLVALMDLCAPEDEDGVRKETGAFISASAVMRLLELVDAHGSDEIDQNWTRDRGVAEE